ncbi:hypothetical protein OH76DRAFT_1412153 [Lentinus brumalis]|uniref:Uncharacterized protein n=1 Tax=Lentinus brumalis TaxID=2498619 RepID=A0A371CMA9_9APHY|nr:hypothetical protein OH76DRAFT_1412153 [Polyporus brumalis]
MSLLSSVHALPVLHPCAQENTEDAGRRVTHITARALPTGPSPAQPLRTTSYHSSHPQYPPPSSGTHQRLPCTHTLALSDTRSYDDCGSPVKS